MYSTFMKSNDDTLDNGAYISLSQGTYSSIAALSKTKILASNVETDRFRWHAPHHNVVDGSGVKLRKGNATFYFASTADSSESTIFSELPLPLEGVLAPDIAFDTELARTEKRISELEAEQVQVRDNDYTSLFFRDALSHFIAFFFLNLALAALSYPRFTVLLLLPTCIVIVEQWTFIVNIIIDKRYDCRTSKSSTTQAIYY